MDRIVDSPLLSKISSKLDELGGLICEIKISITPDAEHFKAKDGSRSYVKWLNWQVYGADEELLYQSDLFLVHGDLEENTIAKNLSRFFPDVNSSIDNEIYFEE